MTGEPPVVEPLPSGQQWVRGDHSARLTLQLRPSDAERLRNLMKGTGIRQSQGARHAFQRGLEVMIMERMGND